MRLNVNLFISEKYELIKKTLKKDLRGNRNLSFDEDIFHDTLLKCIEKYDEINFKTDEEFISYIIVSFKTNLKRDKLYAVNSKRYDGEIEYFASEFRDSNDNSDIDINFLIEEIINNFDEESTNKFIDWLINQMTIKDINKKYNCDNSRYTIDKIKDYIKKNYNINDFR